MAHRLAPRAEADLDDIWLYVARESGSIEIANRLIDTITDRFLTLASFPHIRRSREEDFGAGYRSLAVGEYVIVYCVEGDDALILRVVHGRRQLEAVGSQNHIWPLESKTCVSPTRDVTRRYTTAKARRSVLSAKGVVKFKHRLTSLP